VTLNVPVDDSVKRVDDAELICQLKSPLNVSDTLVLFEVVVVKLLDVTRLEDETVLEGRVFVEVPGRP
jgi:hypothetical protein